jgi:O-acetyl-ADP-ribose deacetylase (regulator of RNase III)
MIQYTKGDAAAPRDNTIIAHVCNDVKVWGGGFVIAITKTLGPKAEFTYRKQANSTKRGTLQLVAIKDAGMTGLYVANMIAQKGVSHVGDKIDYKALNLCLQALKEKAMKNNCTIRMPRIGCGLAGSDWSRIGPLVEEIAKEVNVVVYDF